MKQASAASRRRIAVGICTLAASAVPALAQVDTVSILLPKAETTGGFGISNPPALAAHGYRPADSSDPLHPVLEAYYTNGFNNTAQDIRRIDIGTDGSHTITRLIGNTAWTKFLKAGDLTRGGGAPSGSSLTLNKTAIPGTSIGAYGAAFISDNGGQVTTGGVNNPELTQRIYRYNLALDTNGDASDEFTSLVTLADMRSVAGITTTNPSSNVGRQVALSSDSSTVYFVDSSAATAFGGLWSVNAAGGNLKRVIVDADQNIEPAVVKINGTDRVYINGSAASPGGTNVGGLDYLDTADNTRKVGLSATALAAFAETSVANLTTQSATGDADGNVYFSLNSSAAPERRGIYKLDPQGRLIKVASYAERNSAVAAAVPGQSAIGSSLRLQAHVGTFDGASGPFSLTQLTYNESSANVSAVALVNVFKPGDFNRDNAFTAADGLLFGAKLTPMATTTLLPVADARYDLNGNNLANYKDVKILQSFVGFRNGDANFDLAVGFEDLVTLAQHYNQLSGNTWFTGDFDGDDDVDFADLVTLAQNYSQPALPTVVGASDEFQADWALAQSLVPEPTLLSAAAGVLAIASRRRKV